MSPILTTEYYLVDSEHNMIDRSTFFSVIVPIYNVSRFINLGIRELLNQSFKDFEVILIDDGSTDSSGELCDQLASSRDNIVCYHQDNLGSGPARNLGINKASGDYVVFYDIDDKLEPNLLQICHDEICATASPDVFMFSYDSYDVKYKTITNIVFQELSCASNNEIREQYVDCLLGLGKDNGFVWNKVYKRQFLIDNKLEFPSLLIQQDEVFNLKVYHKAQQLVVSPKILYHYFVYDKGNTRSRFIENRLNIYRTVKNEFLNLYNDWLLDDDRMLKYVYRRYFNSIIESLCFNNTHSDSPLTVKERREEVFSIISDNDVKACVRQLESLNAIPERGFMKWYYKAIKKEDVSMILRTRRVESIWNSLKRTIKGV